MQHSKTLTVKTPAKLILCGEHAVIYGCPALAIAVNLYTQTTVKWSSPLHFSFNLPGLDFRQKITLEALKRLKLNLNKQYEKFDSGDISIREVLKHPFELTLYSTVSVLEKIKHKLPMGVSIHTESEIPMGCGMGSSAANVVSVIHALSEFLNIDFELDDYIRLGIKSENLQHGYSSGLDVHMVYHGGCIYYRPGQFETREIPQFPMQLINTGKPASSTGECVTHTAAHFKDDSLGPKFTRITNEMMQALKENNLGKIANLVRENHRLLVSLGVVPTTVQDFIAEIEAQNMAAKICGAGAVSGENAGVVMVVGEKDISELAKKYGYSITPIQADTRGSHVVSS